MKLLSIKFIRGYLALLILNFCFIILFSFLQSCQSNEDLDTISEQVIAIENFEKVLAASGSKLQSFVNTELFRFGGIEPKAEFISGTLDSQTREALEPLLIGSKDFLLGYGFNQEDLDEIIDTHEEYMLIPVVMIMYEIERKKYLTNNVQSSLLPVNSPIGKSAFAYEQDIDWDQIRICAITATGLDLLISISPEIDGKSNKWTTKALKKLLGKVGSRMLGPVGVAIATASFIACLYGIGFW